MLEEYLVTDAVPRLKVVMTSKLISRQSGVLQRRPFGDGKTSELDQSRKKARR